MPLELDPKNAGKRLLKYYNYCNHSLRWLNEQLTFHQSLITNAVFMRSKYPFDPSEVQEGDKSGVCEGAPSNPPHHDGILPW